jgi:formylglycine-generating enzyme required for sulfatase activity
MVTGESRADTGLERDLFCGAGALGAADTSDYAAFMRAALRSSLKANNTTTSLGFRCARDVLTVDSLSP